MEMMEKFFKRIGDGVYECNWLSSEHPKPEYFDPPSVVRLTHGKLTRLFSAYLKTTRALAENESLFHLTDAERNQYLNAQSRIVATRTALMQHLGFPEDPELFLAAIKEHSELTIVKNHLAEIERFTEISTQVEANMRQRSADSIPVLDAQAAYPLMVFIEMMEVRDAKGDIVSRLDFVQIDNDPWFFDQKPLIAECFQVILDDHIVHLGADSKKFQDTLDKIAKKAEAVLAQIASSNEVTTTSESLDSPLPSNSSSSQDLTTQALKAFQKITPLSNSEDSTPSTS